VACPLARELGWHGREPREVMVVEARIGWPSGIPDSTGTSACRLRTLAVFGFVPQWFYTAKLRLRPLPQDDRDRRALISGLNVLAGVAIGREAA
jgi:hypothetical protein